MDFQTKHNSGHCLRGILIWMWFYGESFDANRRSFEAAGRADRGIWPWLVHEDGDAPAKCGGKCHGL